MIGDVGPQPGRMTFLPEALNTMRASRRTLLLARLFGRRTIVQDLGCTLTMHEYRGTRYLAACTPSTHVLSFDTVVGWIRNLLAAIGLVAMAGLVGLYCSGFFTFIATKYPQGIVANLLGGL